MSARPRLWADPLPLRRGSDLPSWHGDAAVLPWVYGRVTLAPLPWDSAGLVWLLADHPILAVSAVRDGGTPITGWELLHQVDPTGHAVALLRLTRAPQGELSVDLAGRRHATTGALLEHPAEIVEDVCARCGMGPGDWSALRQGWPGMRVGGVYDAAVALREAVGAVVAATGARWSAAPLRAWTPDAGAPVANLAGADCDDIDASADTATLATRLTVVWGYDWAAGGPRGSVVLEAPGALAAFGEIEATLAAPWVRSARDAERLGTAELLRRARPQWSIEARIGPGEAWRPGDRIELTHPWVPSGPAEISEIRRSPAGRTLSLIRPAGPPPTVATLRHGARGDEAVDSPATIEYRDGVATITILDDAGAAIGGARVTLDDGETKTADRLGRVSFRTSRGVHELLVSAPGYAPMELEVEI